MMTKRKMMSFDPNVVEAEENLLIDYQFLLQERMSKNGISHSALAERAGISNARLSQILSDEANPTVKTFAGLFHALGERVCVSSVPLGKLDEGKSSEGNGMSSEEPAQAGKWQWAQPVRMAEPIDEKMVALMKSSVTVLDERSMASNDNYGRGRIKYFDSEFAAALALEPEAA